MNINIIKIGSLIVVLNLLSQTAGAATKVVQPVVSPKQAQAGERVMINQARMELNPDAVSVIGYPGVVVCDPEVTGESCQARIVTLANGQQKAIIRSSYATDRFNVGDLVMVDAQNLAYIDRSQNYTILDGSGNQHFFSVNRTDGGSASCYGICKSISNLYPLRRLDGTLLLATEFSSYAFTQEVPILVSTKDLDFDNLNQEEHLPAMVPFYPLGALQYTEQLEIAAPAISVPSIAIPAVQGH